ncbi:MAG: helix-turn-helix domain-containing protein, partial [Candidatus Thorarchaeota archaeon]
EICNYSFEDYKKIIFETDDMSIIILKLGEDSNIALFFKKEEDKELKLTAIKRYMTRIEELIDMDERELIIQEIIAKEEEIKLLKELLHDKKEIVEKLGKELKELEEGTIEGDIKEITKKLNDFDIECANLNHDIEKKGYEIEQLKEKIEKSH